MLTRFEAQGFKLLRDVAVDLSPLTMLVGANGSGKTTVLDGIDLLLSNAQSAARNGGYWPPGRPLGDRNIAELLSRPDCKRLSLVLQRHMGVAPTIRLELAASARATDSATPNQSIQPEMKAWPSHARLKLDTQRLAEQSIAATGRASLAADGSGLATVLQDVAGRRDGVIDAIESDLTSLVPDFRRVYTDPVEMTWEETDWLEVEGRRFPRVTKRTGGGFRLELAFDRIGRVPATQVSEGTLLALGLITALRVDAPDLILIDDAERALHPLAQQALVHLLHDAIERSEERLQIIATTHSPDLIDACKPEEVRVFGRKPNGSAAIRALTEHPEAQKWLGLLRVGEFWSTVGEDWVGQSAAEESGA